MTETTHQGINYEFTREVAQDAASLGIDVEAEIKTAIDESQHNISRAVVYSKDNCPYCVRAKKLLDDRGITYEEINAVEHRSQLIESVTKASGRPPKTVPQIWLDDQYIGGFTELDAHLRAI